MKHRWQHPEDKGSGRQYWKSVEEFADTQAFREWLQKEFPAGAAELEGDGLSRRSFMRLMGASLALAGLGMSGCRRPEAHLVPFTHTPEWQIPGKYLCYATSMPRPNGGVPLLANTFDGRPVKMEGNPLHPVSKGKSDLHAQASILDLYDPGRARRFLRRGEEVARADFFQALDRLAMEAAGDGGAGVAVLTERFCSPTLDRLRAELGEKFARMKWFEHEPACERKPMCYGPDKIIRLRMERARVILSLDADFLGNGDMETVRGFADGRRLANSQDPMNRLYVVESRYTLTGAAADHRLRLPASQMVAIACALAKEMGVKTEGSAGNQALPDGVDAEWIREAVVDLRSAGPQALVVAGTGLPERVHWAVALVNEALGAAGTTVEVVSSGADAGMGDLKELAGHIRAGEIRKLIILGGNPAYAAPADLEWPKWQGSLAEVIRLGACEDETSLLSTWQVPMAHYLESWGDVLLQDGSYGCVQPMILPLFGGISPVQLMARLAGIPAPEGRQVIEGPELVKQTFRSKVGGLSGAAFDKAWNLFVRDGFLKDSRPQGEKPELNAGNSRPEGTVEVAPVPSPENLELVFYEDYKISDGCYANNGWLQELPDPVTRMTWDNAVLISPVTAKALDLSCRTIKGVETSDVIRIEWQGRSIEAPVFVVPGHPDNSLSLSLGYGRARAGAIGDGVGCNAYLLRTSASPWIMTGVKVSKTGEQHEFAVTQDHWSMEGRGIVREAPLDYYKEHAGFARMEGLESHAKPTDNNFYHSPPFDYEKYNQWGMVIDLTTCTGCHACVIACQAENNIPIVGKDQVRRGREMHWIRIDRYFSGVSKYATDNGHAELPNDPEMVLQPVTCMQCENAPCETVCPVNATVHNEEGLNVMAYNRCIGTRYCANNCPYKVRRFNFFDFNRRQLDELYLSGRLKEQGIMGTLASPLGPKGSPDTIQMQKNPNVTVRMRGVIEKCTFCVQRIEAAKIDWKVKTKRDGSPMPTDGFQTACQQSCPADAIVFGDLADRRSRVVKLKQIDRNYNLLDYLNTKPRLSYLAKLRNPNPRMPGAGEVGTSLLPEEGHGDSPSHGGHES